MADLLSDYYKKLQTVNQQRGMTGNQNYNQGIDASLAEGYFDSVQKNKQNQEELALRKEALSSQQQNQAGYLDLARQNRDSQRQDSLWQQAYSRDALNNQKSNATTSLIGQTVSGAANLYNMSKYIDKLGNKTTPDMTTAPAYTGEVSGIVQPADSLNSFTGSTPAFDSNAFDLGSANQVTSSLNGLDYYQTTTSFDQTFSPTYDWGSSFSWLDDFGGLF